MSYLVMRTSTVVKYLTFISTLMLLNACGGGGSSAVPSPTVSIGASGSSIELNNSLDLSWSSTSAESCTASNDWTGVKSISGSEALTLSSLGDQTFTLTCRNSSGSTSQSVEVEVYRIVTGVVVDGYITGSSLFCDTNGNFVLDPGEESVTSASDGSFSVRAGVCNLVSLGGFDTDMNNALDDLLLVTPLRASQAEAVVSPITTVASFMENPEDLNAILGVDPSIDLMTTDLVAKKGTSDEYDLLYEKGNQLTVLAYVLQKAMGDTGDTSEDAFSSITKVLEDTYELSEGKVDIESSAFIETVVEAVATTSGASLSAEIKTNITTVLVNVLPLIQVRDDNKASQDILNFATDTLLNDIEKIADGSASAATLEQYTTQATSYIATSQGGSASDYAVNIFAVNDTVSGPKDTNILIKILANDDYLTDGALVEVTLTDASSGTLSLDADNQVTYTPLAGYTGTDSFTYTLKQGDKSKTALVTITISTYISLSSNSFSIAENTSTIGIFPTTNADGDTLTYSLSGTDASKFNISSTGEFKLEAAADYESQSSYSLTILVSDGTETVSEDVTVVITNVIETAPTLTLPATISIAENTSIVTQAVATDLEGSALTYALSGADAATFYLTSTGLVSFRTVPNYESLSKTQYNITVTVTNAGGLTASGAMVVNVTDISENFFDTCRFGECKFE
jgi:hypothetical protein